MFQILVLSLNAIFNCQHLFKLINIISYHFIPFHFISSFFNIGFIWCQVWGVSSHPSLLLEPLSLWSQLFETVAKPQMLTKELLSPWIQGPSNVSHFCIFNIIRFLLVFFAASIHFPFSFGTFRYPQFPSPIPPYPLGSNALNDKLFGWFLGTGRPMSNSACLWPWYTPGRKLLV